MPGAPFELRWSRRLNKRRIGDQGEALALRYLMWKGYKLVERNYRTRYGEVDLIVSDERTLIVASPSRFPEGKSLLAGQMLEEGTVEIEW